MESYWLLKTEPREYSWDDLLREKETCWDGVRNFEARNFIKKMKIKDQVFIYHTGKERRIMGLAEVSSDPYPDPSFALEEGLNPWFSINVSPIQSFARKVTLQEMKTNPSFEECLLLSRARLSVIPFNRKEFQEIRKLSVL